MTAGAIITTALASLTAAEPSPLATNQSHENLFAYDRSADLEVKDQESKKSDDVSIRDIDYPSYKNRHGRIKAYLVRPSGDGPFAGILYFHWLGEKKADRTEFLDEAVALARRGVVSLLIQGFFPWSEPPVDGAKDVQQIVDQTIEVRRALDLLLSQPGVDQQRIGFVGHDYGAMFGTILAGLEHRAKAYVLMAGLGNFGDWSLKYWPKTRAKGEEAYRQAVSVADPINYVSNASPASLFFQFSKNDKYISKAAADEFFRAASEPKTIKWYDVSHDLESHAASVDRVAWLAKELGLKNGSESAASE